jgi:hypothetical protein
MTVGKIAGSTAPVGCEPAPHHPPVVHKIENGDTLWDLTSRMMEKGLKGSREEIMHSILEMNPDIKNPDLIYAGKSLNLPMDPGEKSKHTKKNEKAHRTPHTKDIETPKPPKTEKNEVHAFDVQQERAHARLETNVFEKMALHEIGDLPKGAKKSISLSPEFRAKLLEKEKDGVDLGVGVKGEFSVDVVHEKNGSFSITVREAYSADINAKVKAGGGSRFGIEKGRTHNYLTAEGAADAIGTMVRHGIAGDDPNVVKRLALQTIDQFAGTDFGNPKLQQEVANLQKSLVSKSGGFEVSVSGAVGPFDLEVGTKPSCKTDFAKHEYVISKEVYVKDRLGFQAELGAKFGIKADATAKISVIYEEKIKLSPEQFGQRLTEEQARAVGKTSSKVVLVIEGSVSGEIAGFGKSVREKVTIEVDAKAFAQDSMASVLNARATVQLTKFESTKLEPEIGPMDLTIKTRTETPVLTFETTPKNALRDAAAYADKVQTDDALLHRRATANL